MSADHQHHDGVPSPVATKDPVCGMDVAPGQASGGSAEHDGTTYWFCSAGCREKFVADPGRYVVAASPLPGGGGIYTCPMHPEVRQPGPGSCPRCGMALERVAPAA